MSPAFEAFLAKIYVDADARNRFLNDPHTEAHRAGLTPAECAAAADIDRVGLAMAGASFEAKRRAHKRPQSWFERLAYFFGGRNRS